MPPRARRARGAARDRRAVGSVSSGASWMSAIATVRSSRAARFETGRRRRVVAQRRAPSASSTRATTGSSPSASPRRTKQRAASSARPTSSTAAASAESRSSSVRSRRPIEASMRSRCQRLAERDRRARALERDRRLRREGLHDGQVVGRERAIVVGRRDGDHGDHAVVADRAARRRRSSHPPRLRDASSRGSIRSRRRRRSSTPRRQRSRCRKALGRGRRGRPATRPRPCRSRGRGSPRPRGRPPRRRRARRTRPRRASAISSRSARATPSTSDVRASSAGDPPQALELPLALRRARGRRLAPTRPGGEPDREAEREHADENGDALPRERKAVQADGKRLGSRSCWAPRLYGARGRSRRSVFRLQRGIPPRSKDGSTGPLWARRGRDSVPRTGRCEPRARTWPCNPR